MSELDVKLAGKSLADFTNTQLRLALGAVLYTNTADMWKRYLNQLGYSGDVSQMLQKYYVEYSVPQNFRNYINAGAFIYSPQQLFTDGSKGVVYDNNDLSSFYLDAAGTTPATVNGLVGLQFDKSANLALGAELLASGVIALTGVATAATYSTTTGVGTVTRVDASNQSYVTWTGLDATAYYQITISNTGAGLLYVRTGAGIGLAVVTISAGNTVTCSVLASGSAISIAADSGTANFTLGTIKKLPGNHRYQTTTGSKPVLRGTPTGANLVANGDFASGTGWIPNTWVISGGSATATNVSDSLAQNISFTAGNVYRVTFTVTAFSGTGGVRPRFFGGTTVTGSTRSATGTYVEYMTAVAGNNQFALASTTTTATITVDNVEIVDVSAGQVTAPYGLQYDGVDDFLQTAAVDFTATDKMFVCAGVRKLSDAARGVLSELSVNAAANAGSYLIEAPGNIAAEYRVTLYGTSAAQFTVTPYATPVSNVLAISYDIAGAAAANEIVVRVNGATPTLNLQTTPAGTGNFGNYALYFGRRAGTSLPYNGLDFGLVICGKTLTSTQISQTERYIAQRTGVTL